MIHVETFIRGRLDEVWEKTQEPAVHERWDLRFSEISYRPRAEGEPQRFRYATRVGFGRRLEGWGESTGARDDATGGRVSALRFGSESPFSLIRAGSGHWRYVPEKDGVRFLTRYDYTVRGGALGRLVDRLVTRPLLAWATAWSFDRLRLWVEKGLDPFAARRAALAHAMARVTLAFVFAYHGLVPKLLVAHGDEIAMLRDAGVPAGETTGARLAAGAAEVLFAVVLLAAWRRAWPLWASMAGMVVATAAVALNSPRFLVAAFNPVSLNLSVATLAAVALVVRPDVPFAGRCTWTANERRTKESA